MKRHRLRGHDLEDLDQFRGARATVEGPEGLGRQGAGIPGGHAGLGLVGGGQCARWGLGQGRGGGLRRGGRGRHPGGLRCAGRRELDQLAGRIRPAVIERVAKRGHDGWTELADPLVVLGDLQRAGRDQAAKPGR